MNWLKRLFRSGREPDNTADSMTDLRRSDPCWCGSGRHYGKCHCKEDLKRMRALGINQAALRSNPFV